MSPEQVWQPPPWGLFATLGLTLVVVVAFHLSWAVFGIVYVLALYSLDTSANIRELTSHLDSGLFNALATCVVSPLLIGMVALLIRLRRRASVGHYLALRPTPGRLLFKWLAVLSVVYLSVDGINYMLGRPIVPRVNVREYETGGIVPIFWISTILVAPLFEEILFRGFVFRGVQYSALGDLGAVLITSLVWSWMHWQYGWFDVGTIFMFGIILGAARARTKTLVVPIALHVWMNLVATVEVAVYVHTR